MNEVPSSGVPRRRRGKTVAQILFLLLLIAGTVMILRRHSSERLQTSQGPVFGTFYKIAYVYSSPLDSAIVAELRKVDFSLSMFNQASIVSRINRNESQETDTLFREVYNIARLVAEQTDGAYDVTVAPLVNAWGFGTAERADVSSQQLDSIKTFVGYRKVRMSGTRVQKADGRVQLDFSSVAKGYGVDRVARLFDSLHIQNYMIEIGGEVIVKGMHPEGRPWIIGISKPADAGSSEAGDVQQTLSITNTAMATSGNYRRFYELGGKRYAHTIDPIAGYPVQHNLLSATVFASGCAMADAYATAFMVMGLEKAQAFLKHHPELMAYFIYTDSEGKYRVWHSKELNKFIRR